MTRHAFKHIWPLLVEPGAEALAMPQVAGHALAAAYRPLLEADVSRTLVIGQLGQSLDGRIATPSGCSDAINGAAALDHLHRLRALADAVIVGAGTMIADNPRLSTRRVSGRSPARVLIDPRGRARGAERWLAEDGCRRLVFSDAEDGWPSCVERIGSPGADGVFPPTAIIAALARRGLHKLLIEGGADTISRFIDAGAMDRLHVLLAPVIIGSGMPGLTLKPIDGLEAALRPPIRRFPLEGGDVLFDCDLRRGAV
jgi:riboflavin-specific deaminase-like protein